MLELLLVILTVPLFVVLISPLTLIPEAPLLVIFKEEPLFVIVPELSRLIPAAPVLEISVLPVFVIEPKTFNPFAPLFEIVN